MKFKQFVSPNTDSEKSIKDKQKQALYNELKTSEDNKKKDILKKLKLKEARDKIYQAKVKDIPVGTVAEDSYYKAVFNRDMKNKVRKTIRVKLASDDTNGKNWYISTNYVENYVYHKSWLDFDVEQELDI